MAKLVTMLEQHSDRQPTTVVIQATTWWEAVLAHVKLQECGLGVHLPVIVCCYSSLLFLFSITHDIALLSTAVDCGPLSGPANGQVTHTAGTTFGQTATYSCNTGYNLLGDSIRTCQAAGVWSGHAPTCHRMLLLQTFQLEHHQVAHDIWGCPHTVLTNGSYSPLSLECLFTPTCILR